MTLTYPAVVDAEPKITAPAQLTTTTALPYPQGMIRGLLRLPVLLYRLGLGRLLGPAHIMVLTTRGRKTGLPRHTAIEYRAHGSKLYVVSGWGARPDWFKNILADPVVTVQIGNETRTVAAQPLTDCGEVARALYLFRKPTPVVFDTMLTQVCGEAVSSHNLPDISDQVTVVRMDPAPQAGPPPVRADLRGLWLVLPALLLIYALIRR